MKKISLAYFGSPDFAAYFLEKLLTDTTINQLIEVKLIVTQKDKLVGRKQILTPTPVKEMAKKYQLSIINNQSILNKLIINKNLKIDNSLNIEQLKIDHLDLALVYAYGDLIPKELLTLPKYGFWNIHPSLLPKYRGPSPIAAPLINGDKTTGVTIIKMDEEIDHGPIIAQESLTIEKNDKRPDLEKKLTDLGFKMFKKIIKNSLNSLNSLNIKIQNDKEATYTKKLTKQDGFISIENLIPPFAGENSSEYLYNLFRGLYPWPGLWTMIKPVQPTRLDEAKRLKIIDLQMVRNKDLCSLRIKRVQLEGKNEVDFETFNEAYKIF